MISRMCLVYLVVFFEAASRGFYERLVELRKIKHLKSDRYKHLLKWVFEAVKKSSSASAEALARLPKTCGDVDNAGGCETQLCTITGGMTN